MPLRYVLDENLRGHLCDALRHHNAAGIYPVDVTRVGDPPDLLLGTADSDLLLWSEREGRVLVTLDENTIPGHLTAHLQQGHHSPGVFILRTRCPLAQLVFELVLAAYVYDPADVADQIRYVP